MATAMPGLIQSPAGPIAKPHHPGPTGDNAERPTAIRTARPNTAIFQGWGPRF